jgi:hypothetical protein
MKFEIRRTSCYDEKPHCDAIEEIYTRIDSRTISTLKKARELIKEKKWIIKWLEEGKNHREIEVNTYQPPNSQEKFNTMIARDIEGDKRWVIEIIDIFQWLIDLDEEIVLSPPNVNNAIVPLFKIEIYDDYRE